ncbi:hypothetical protein [Brevibacterium moorei]|uniref:hypothetical protein n=1 Tax=Brevibacterium moorei TaxID=2968457 RepID=UPI00211C7355|nr:hypothetical protein [Brevibacterium sp. 68QC2CO]MCQ9384460.1 hypothetical protein [Brevibacterium sp. 68QC2CO]
MSHPFWTAPYASRQPQYWLFPAAALAAGLYSLIAGVDLAIDQTTENEVFAFANLVGTQAWGIMQAIAGALVVGTILFRWIAGIIISTALAGTVWLMWAWVLLQGTLRVFAEQGGLRIVAAPAFVCVMFWLLFVTAVVAHKEEEADAE